MLYILPVNKSMSSADSLVFACQIFDTVCMAMFVKTFCCLDVQHGGPALAKSRGASNVTIVDTGPSGNTCIFLCNMAMNPQGN